MRLIDAEQFIEKMGNNIGNIYNPDIIKGMRFAVDLITTLPTAYDVDKVVGRLEEKISEIKDQLMYTHDEDMAVRLRCKMHGLDEALEIVKAVE